MEITTEFEFTYELYRRSYSLHRKTVLAKSARRVFLFWICPAGAIFSLAVACYYKSAGNGDASGIAVFLAIALAFWYGCGWLSQWITVRRGYQQSLPATAKSTRVRVTVNDSSVCSFIAGSIRSEIPWGDICRVEQDPKFVLLYVNKLRYIPIAMDTMDCDKATALRAFVQQKAGNVHRC